MNPPAETAIPTWKFELDIPLGRLIVEQPEPLDAELRAILDNAIKVLAGTSGLRVVGQRQPVSATNPRAEQVKAALENRGRNGQGQGE